VATVRTLEEFFRMKLSLKTIAAIEPNAENSKMSALRREFYFFREGIQPEWEDENNADGGRWSTQPSDLDTAWNLWTTLAVGEQLGPEPHIARMVNGLCVTKRETNASKQMRKGAKVNVWMRSCQEQYKDDIMKLGQFLYNSQAGAVDFTFEQLKVATVQNKMMKPPILARCPGGWGASPPPQRYMSDGGTQPSTMSRHISFHGPQQHNTQDIHRRL